MKSNQKKYGTNHKDKQVLFWNRALSRVEQEKVYGSALVEWLYGSSVGQVLVEKVLPKNRVSEAYGVYQSSWLSRRQIAPFIENFQIPMEEFEAVPYYSFNDFFIRRFKRGVRPFASEPSELPAFAEARYFAYDKVEDNQKVPVKGIALSPAGLLGSAEKAVPFQGGPLLLARLCPTDYHRFHFPDAGKFLDVEEIGGDLHSVNPVALGFKRDILITNERHVSILQTENFGKLAYVEVGALCVGKIVQRVSQNQEFKRGDEKGYFLFGGSTVVVLGEPGKWVPDADLLEQTSKGLETLVRLGERVAKKIE